MKEKSSLVLLIQPYGGGYFSSVRNNFKYVYLKRRKEDFLFDLAADPNESTDLMNSFQDKELLRKFKDDINKILFNNYLIENNLTFPKGSPLVSLKEAKTLHQNL